MGGSKSASSIECDLSKFDSITCKCRLGNKGQRNAELGSRHRSMGRQTNTKPSKPHHIPQHHSFSLEKRYTSRNISLFTVGTN
jgi:hypothetical protein